MIVQVRAPGGAGKSTTVERLLDDHGGEVIDVHDFVRTIKPGTPDEQHKTERMKLWRCEAGLHVLGSYGKGANGTVSSGSGADKVNGPLAYDILKHYTDLGLPHLVWESKFGSTQVPDGPLLSLELEAEMVWATLDTPADECIRRTYQRRPERGENPDKPLAENSIRSARRGVDRSAAEGLRLGIPGVTLKWDDDPYAQLHDLLIWGGWGCAHTADPTRRRWEWDEVLPAREVQA